ncbi:MAG: hypothetical protein U0414_31315 [Polyangiaceae bacterium]
MKVSITIECPAWLKTVAKLVLPAVAICGVGMAVAAPPNVYTAGQTLTAASLNENFASQDARLGALETKTFVEARIMDTVPMQFPTSTFTKIAYATEAADTLSEYDAPSATFTAKSAGTYSVCAGFAGSQFVEDFEVDVFINGARDQAFVVGSKSVDAGAAGRGCAILALDAGDKLDFRLYHDSPGAASITGDQLWDVLTIARL